MSNFLFMLEFELAGLGRSCACHNNPCDFIYAAGLLCPDDIVSLSLLSQYRKGLQMLLEEEGRHLSFPAVSHMSPKSGWLRKACSLVQYWFNTTINIKGVQYSHQHHGSHQSLSDWI